MADTKPRRRALLIVLVGVAVFAATLVGLLVRASRASDSGNADRAEFLYLGIAVTLGALALVAVAGTALIHFRLEPAKRRANNLRSLLPEAVVFLVADPIHQGRFWPDSLNGSGLPNKSAVVFAAEPEGIGWWIGPTSETPTARIDAARIVSVGQKSDGETNLPKLVLQLQEPEHTILLTVIGDGSTGFKLSPPDGFEAFLERVKRTLGR